MLIAVLYASPPTSDGQSTRPPVRGLLCLTAAPHPAARTVAHFAPRLGRAPARRAGSACAANGVRLLNVSEPECVDSEAPSGRILDVVKDASYETSARRRDEAV